MTIGHRFVSKMNALRLKTQVLPHVAVDQLIADHGLVRVALAILIRTFRRSLPVNKQPPVKLRHYHLNAHMRRDIGLPPEPPPSVLADLSHLQRTHFR